MDRSVRRSPTEAISMPPSARLIASETLMCGFKSLPIVGKAFEVVDAVRNRHEVLLHGQRLDEVESQMSRMERRLRDLVAEEIRGTLDNLGRPGLDGATLTDELRNLRAIQAQGWDPALFEGLIRNSTHWDELRRHPNHYGRVLDDHASLNPEAINVLIDTDSTRILEVTPFAFASLLANQSQGVPPARIESRVDIWAFADGQASADPLPPTPGPELETSIGLKLLRIEPGTFPMGSKEGEHETPIHQVRITRPFALGVFPVTQGQYTAVMGTNPSHFQGSAEFPVEKVSWFDAVAFCNKLSEREGRSPYYGINGKWVIVIGGEGFRLPTEAEWEYACRAGTSTRFPFGDDEATLCDHAWYSGNSGGQTHPVGGRQPNAWGLHDMLGNVWEWVQDWYAEDYYKTSPPADPAGPSSASYRGIRGGSWSNDPRDCRPAYRTGYAPEYRYDILGFRVAAVQE